MSTYVANTAHRLTARTSRAAHQRFVLLAAEFNPAITRALIRGAIDTLRHHGVSQRQIRLLWVPGAFELPVVAARIATTRPRPDAIIALGALIRGATPQYEVIAHAVAQGLSQVSVDTRIPVTFGLIVATTLAQARARAGLPRRRRGGDKVDHTVNRGAEAALAALAVLRLFETV